MTASPDPSGVSLGFTANPVPRGTHLCLIYSSEEERRNSLLKFVQSGLAHGERTACFSDKLSVGELREFLAAHQIDLDEQVEHGALLLSGTAEVYFQDNRFEPERMLHNLDQFYQSSKDEGYPDARVIGEMTPEIEHVSGGERLLEYESRVSLMLRDHPLTAVCQYDANAFDGATILEVLKVHPKMLVNGAVVENPFFVPPEEYLQSLPKPS